MSLRKLRVEYWDGVKIVVLRDGSLPSTYDDFMHLILSKIGALEAASRDYVLRLKYKDADGKSAVHLDDDDDLLIMYESSMSWTVNVEAEEVTEENHGRLWSPERFRDHKPERPLLLARPPPPAPQSAVARPAEGTTTPSTSTVATAVSRSDSFGGAPAYSNGTVVSGPPPFPNGSGALAGAPPPYSNGNGTLPNSPAPLSNGSVALPSSPPPPSSLSRPASYVSSAATIGTIQTQPAPSITYATLSQPMREKKVDDVTVAAGGRQFRFTLEWKSSAGTPAHEIMGVLGKQAWSAQRACGYKQGKMDDGEMIIPYVPRKSTLRSRVTGEASFYFSFMFEYRALYEAAGNFYPSKVEALSPAEFGRFFIESVGAVRGIGKDRTPVTTEWVCVRPPEQLVPETPRNNREYAVLYVVKDTRQDMSETAKARVGKWIKAQMVGGSWGTDIISRGPAPSADKNPKVDSGAADMLRFIA